MQTEISEKLMAALQQSYVETSTQWAGAHDDSISGNRLNTDRYPRGLGWRGEAIMPHSLFAVDGRRIRHGATSSTLLPPPTSDDNVGGVTCPT